MLVSVFARGSNEATLKSWLVIGTSEGGRRWFKWYLNCWPLSWRSSIGVVVVVIMVDDGGGGGVVVTCAAAALPATGCSRSRAARSIAVVCSWVVLRAARRWLL